MKELTSMISRAVAYAEPMDAFVVARHLRGAMEIAAKHSTRCLKRPTHEGRNYLAAAGYDACDPT